MPLPTPSKTWSYDLNQGPYTGPSDSGTTMAGWQTHWKGLKNSLVGFSSGWTVAGSSANGQGGAMDSVDRWALADLESTNTDSGSWIVLQNDAIRTGFQLLIQVQDGGGGWPDSSTWRVSPGGNYTGGSETGRPTATDEITLSDNVNWDQNRGQANSRIHTWMSDDGECTRILICNGGSTRAFYLFDKPLNPVAGWTDPWVAIAVQFSGASNVPDYGDIANVSTYGFSSVGSTTMKLFCTSEGWAFGAGSSAAGQRMTWGNDLDGGAWPMSPIGLASETSGVRGRHGGLYDIWFGSTTRASADNYPSTLPRQFVQVGDIVLPWDNAAGTMQTV